MGSAERKVGGMCLARIVADELDQRRRNAGSVMKATDQKQAEDIRRLGRLMGMRARCVVDVIDFRR